MQLFVLPSLFPTPRRLKAHTTPIPMVYTWKITKKNKLCLAIENSKKVFFSRTESPNGLYFSRTSFCFAGSSAKAGQPAWISFSIFRFSFNANIDCRSHALVCKRNSILLEQIVDKTQKHVIYFQNVVIETAMFVNEFQCSISDCNWQVLIENYAVYNGLLQKWHPKMCHASLLWMAFLKSSDHSFTTPNPFIRFRGKCNFDRYVLYRCHSTCLLIPFISALFRNIMNGFWLTSPFLVEFHVFRWKGFKERRFQRCRIFPTEKLSSSLLLAKEIIFMVNSRLCILIRYFLMKYLPALNLSTFWASVWIGFTIKK